jgi:hypothetical protein
MWYHVGSIEEFPTERDWTLQPFGLGFGLFSHRTAQPLPHVKSHGLLSARIVVLLPDMDREFG